MLVHFKSLYHSYICTTALIISATFLTLDLDYSWALRSALFVKLPDLTVVKGLVIYFSTSEGLY